MNLNVVSILLSRPDLVQVFYGRKMLMDTLKTKLMICHGFAWKWVLRILA